MSSAPPPSRLVGRVALAMYAVLLVAITKYAAAPLINPDTYFHLRFGHEFLTDWSLRNPGSVSSLATRDWLPTQWLSQITMARFEEMFGLPGVAWLFGTVLMGYTVVIYLVCRLRSSAVIAVTVTTLALMGSAPGLSARPQLLSYVFAAVVTHAWLRTADDTRPRWWLIPVIWLWAMCHGMWPVGLTIGVAATVGITLDRAASRTQLIRLVSVTALCAIAAALTPIGPALYGAVFTVTGRSAYYTEWGPASFTHAAPLIVAVMVAVCVTVYARSRAVPWSRVAILVLALGWALYSLRTVPVAAAIGAPLLAEALRGRQEIASTGRGERLVTLAAPLACLVVLGLVVPSTSDAPLPTPAWLDAQLRELPAGTPVLTESSLGSFLVWKFPELDFTTDGYGDAYTTEALETDTAIASLAPGWDGLVAESGARVAVLKSDSALVYGLTHAEGWSSARPSNSYVVLTAPAGWPAETLARSPRAVVVP